MGSKQGQDQPTNQNSTNDRLKYKLNQQGGEMQVVERGGERQVKVMSRGKQGEQEKHQEPGRADEADARQVLWEGGGGAQEHKMATEHWEHRWAGERVGKQTETGSGK